MDALVDVVKSGPACAGQLLPAGAVLELLQDTVKLRAFLGKAAEELDHQGAMGDALFRMEECVKGRLGPAGAALPTEGGGSTPGGPGSGAGGGEPPDFGGPSDDHGKGSVLLDVHLFVADDTEPHVSRRGGVRRRQVRGRWARDPGPAAAVGHLRQRERADGGGHERRRGPGGDLRGGGEAAPALRINGVPTALGSGVVRLPRGGWIRLREGHYVVVWPDTSMAHVWSQGRRLLALEAALPPQRPAARSAACSATSAPRRAATPPIAQARCSRCRASLGRCIARSSTTASETAGGSASRSCCSTTGRARTPPRITDRSFPRVLTRLADLSADSAARRRRSASRPGSATSACWTRARRTSPSPAIRGSPRPRLDVQGASFVASPAAGGHAAAARRRDAPGL